MFWLVVTLVVVLFVGMYCGFSVLISQNTGSGAFKNNTIEDQRIEAREYLDIHIRCGSTIDELLRGVSPVSKIKTFPSKEITDDSAVLVRSLDDNYNEFKMESRIDGQTVSFWTRTGSQGLPSTQGPIPFIIYLSRASKDQIPIKEALILLLPISIVILTGLVVLVLIMLLGILVLKPMYLLKFREYWTMLQLLITTHQLLRMGRGGDQ